jgi:hypothetical protein
MGDFSRKQIHDIQARDKLDNEHGDNEGGQGGST